MIVEKIQSVLIFMPAFLFALSFHEFAHGWVAKRLGDTTAERMGRLTLNPMAHADMLGTFILPIISLVSGLLLFGWAKPVPVNPNNFSPHVNRKSGMFWVALAGPAANVILAICGSLAYVILYKVAGATYSYNQAVNSLLITFIMLNFVLAFFNLIPIHPLDGGKILARFLPPEANMFLERNQGALNMALLVLILLGGITFIGRYVQMATSATIRIFEFLLSAF